MSTPYLYEQVITQAHPGFFGPLPPSITYKGVKVPHWEFYVSRPEHPSRAVDAALSAANGVLNVILAPVRAFVGGVLHPLFGLLDSAYDLVADFVQSVFGRAVDLAYSVGDAIEGGTQWAVFLAGRLAEDVRSAAASALAVTGYLLNVALAAVKSEAEDLYRLGVVGTTAAVNGIADLARRLVADAYSALSGIIDAVRRDAAQWFHDAATLAGQGLSDVRQWAADLVNAAEGLAVRAVTDLRHWAETAIRDAVGALEAVWRAIVRDVIDPIVHKVEDFLSNEWRAAKALLGVLEDAAGWIIFVTTHVVPEVENVVKWAEQQAGRSVQSLVEEGARAGASLVS